MFFHGSRTQAATQGNEKTAPADEAPAPAPEATPRASVFEPGAVGSPFSSPFVRAG